MTGDYLLVRFGVLNTLGEVLLGEIVVSVLLITLQGLAVVFQFGILGMKVVVALHHLRDIGMKTIHLGLEVLIGRKFPSGGLPMRGYDVRYQG
ncbi:unnamed protein product [Prunus armeniaca]